MKLYIFYDCLYDYTGGMAAVLAESEEHAVSILKSKYYTHEICNEKITENVGLMDWELIRNSVSNYKVIEKELDQPIAFYTYGGA